MRSTNAFQTSHQLRMLPAEFGGIAAPKQVTPGHLRVLTWVGASAVALGVGAAIASMPAVASADSTGSAARAARRPADHRSTTAHAGPEAARSRGRRARSTTVRHAPRKQHDESAPQRLRSPAHRPRRRWEPTPVLDVAAELLLQQWNRRSIPTPASSMGNGYSYTAETCCCGVQWGSRRSLSATAATASTVEMAVPQDYSAMAVRVAPGRHRQQWRRRERRTRRPCRWQRRRRRQRHQDRRRRDWRTGGSAGTLRQGRQRRKCRRRHGSRRFRRGRRRNRRRVLGQRRNRRNRRKCHRQYTGKAGGGGNGGGAGVFSFSGVAGNGGNGGKAAFGGNGGNGGNGGRSLAVLHGRQWRRRWR